MDKAYYLELIQKLGKIMDETNPHKCTSSCFVVKNNKTETELELAVSNPYNWKELTLRKLNRNVTNQYFNENKGHLKIIK